VQENTIDTPSKISIILKYGYHQFLKYEICNNFQIYDVGYEYVSINIYKLCQIL